MNNRILELEHIEKYYQETGKKLHILRDLSFHIEEGEFVTILGRSGSGKSTLLNLIGLLDKADFGKIFLSGKNLAEITENEKNILRNEFLGFVFQFHYLLAEFTALENVMLPAMLANKKNKREIEERAVDLLKSVGLGERLQHKPNQLSGGEKQRVAIARALINEPKLLLADEPTGNLDEETSETIFDIFREINQKYGQTIIVVTHSRELAKISSRQIYLKKGMLEENEKRLEKTE